MKYIHELLYRYPELSPLQSALEEAVGAILTCYRSGAKLILCGNGGSEADCDHIVGELLKSFRKKRPPRGERLTRLTEALGAEGAFLEEGIPALALPSIHAALTAYSNDVCPRLAYAQLLFALGRPGDLFCGISTSGNAENVCAAAKTARALQIRTLCLTGEDGGALASLCDLSIRTPARETYRIQEYHLPIYHALCAQAEALLFPEEQR